MNRRVRTWALKLLPIALIFTVELGIWAALRWPLIWAELLLGVAAIFMVAYVWLSIVDYREVSADARP